MTKSIAIEEAGNGITANMVCPGDITGEWKEKNIEEAAEVQENASPVGRPGTGEDIARVISFLTDEKSDFITGSIIPVTGAKTSWGKFIRCKFIKRQKNWILLPFLYFHGCWVLLFCR